MTIKNITLKLTFDEAAVVYLSLLESQKGYSHDFAVPERIVAIRQIMSDLEKSMTSKQPVPPDTLPSS